MPTTKQTIKIGDTVKVLKSNHPDVWPETIGSIAESHDGGFGVVIVGEFGLGENRIKEARTIWFAEENLQPQ